jgi:hypothetical protein
MKLHQLRGVRSPRLGSSTPLIEPFANQFCENGAPS